MKYGTNQTQLGLLAAIDWLLRQNNMLEQESRELVQ
jgi:hypothetical protein